MRKFILHIVFLLLANIVTAQFSGGDDDGYFVSCYTQQDGPDWGIFSGGDDDGTSVSCYTQQDSPDWSIYFGGDDDGASVSCYTQQDNPDWFIYAGGSYASTISNCLGAIGTEVPLPVELINFQAQANNSSVDVTWQTASEKNNDYFIVQKSKDAINWEFVEEVNGAGNSVELLDYAIEDRSPFLGVNYYRLKQVDFDGKVTWSEIRSVVFDAKGGVMIYPNPVKEQLFFANLPEEAEIIINDVQGNFILSTNTSTIDVQNMKNGVYFAVIQSKTTSEIKKFVVTH